MKLSKSFDCVQSKSIYARCFAGTGEAETSRAAGREDELGQHGLAVLREDFERGGVEQQAQCNAAVNDTDRGFVQGGELGVEIRFPRVRAIHGEARARTIEANGGGFVGPGVELERERGFRTDAGEGAFNVEQ
jgi:hypothetical protein